MSGQRPPRSLPPLARLTAAPGRRAAPGNLTAAATDWLRGVARRLQGEHSMPFYSMREVATHLGMSLADVARVYRRVAEEGLLTIRRSAPTMLAPREEQPRRAVRGVVTLPVWQYSYCAWTDWRRFFTAIGSALREQHYAVDFSLYGADEITDRSFAAGLRARAPDYLLWFGLPGGVNRELLALHDAGTRLALVTICPTGLPAAHYVLQWAEGLKHAVAAYVKDGIRRLTVLLPEAEELQPWAERILRAAPLTLDLRHAQGTPSELQRLLAKLPRRADTAIFSPNEDWFWRLSRTDMQTLIASMTTTRWLTLHRLSLPSGIDRGLRADLIVHDWGALAARIADDIANHRLPAPDAPQRIEAAGHPRACAADFAQEF
jgi:hypothetical protein